MTASKRNRASDSLRVRLTWGAAALLLYWGLLLVGTHLPMRRVAQLGQLDEFLPLDKLVHAGAFAGLTLLAGWVFIDARRARWTSFLILAFVMALYGAADEYTQGFVRYRTPSWGDWKADLLGTALGLACLSRLFAWQRTRPAPPPVEDDDEFD